MIAIDVSTAVDQLGGILTFLNPPQQDYEKLADRASSYLASISQQPSVIRAIATYCDLFGRGYALWQLTYDYPRIHEYFYGAYLQAVKQGGQALSAEAGEALGRLTEAMINYTWCENAMIVNDPQGLLTRASAAVEHGEAAEDLLRRAALPQALLEPIGEYLAFNLALFRGLRSCARGYLAARAQSDIPREDYETIQASLATLKETSYELFSELRAHYAFMLQHIQNGREAMQEGSPALRVMQGDMLLRGIGYSGEKLVAGLFEAHEASAERLLADARKHTGLPIVSIHSSYMPDVFETALGREYRSQMTIDLCGEDTELTFTVPDGAESRTYSVDKFQVTMSRFGGMAFEVGCSVEDVSVSHVRIFESMIGPHSGRFPIDWKGAPSELEDDIDLLAARRMLTFVETFLRSRAWIEHLRRVTPGPDVERMAEILTEWRDALTRLAPQLPQQGALGSEGERTINPGLKACYVELRQCQDAMNKLACAWMDAHTSPELADEVATGRDIFPDGLRFGRLMDIGAIVLDRVRAFLVEAYGQHDRHRAHDTEGYQDIRYASDFDPNTGWQTIFCCNQLALVRPQDGEVIEPLLPGQCEYVREHPEFKGFRIQSREARAGIDDWVFVPDPDARNLALIRSHSTDAMYVGENRTFLWFPDDPQFNLTIYIESARLIGDIRILVLAYNASAKKQISQTEAMLDRLQSGQRLPRWQAREFEDSRSDITVFRTHAERTLDLLRACTISKYEDHGRLLTQMLIENKAGNAQGALEHNLNTLDEFHAHITTLLQRRIGALAQSGQTLTAGMLFLLTAVSALSAIPTLEPFLATSLNGIVNVGTVLDVTRGILIAILVGGVGVALYAVWQRSRSI